MQKPPSADDTNLAAYESELNMMRSMATAAEQQLADTKQRLDETVRFVPNEDTVGGCG